MAAASSSSSTTPLSPRSALSALQSIDAVALDAASLLGGLQSSLQALTQTSAEHMAVYSNTAAHTREAVTSSVAASRGLVDKCVALDARMAEVDRINAQLGDVDLALTTLEEAFNSHGIPPLPPRR